MDCARWLRLVSVAILLLATPARAASVPAAAPLVVFQPTALSAFQPEPDSMYDVAQLQGMSMSALSPDGQFLYVASWYANTISTFERDAATGKLTLVQVLDYYIQVIDGLFGAQGVALSPDGNFVYVSSGDGGGMLAVFSRDGSTGALTFIEDAGSPAPVDDLRGSAMSPDGTTLYTMEDTESTVIGWDRDGITGELTFIGTFVNPDVGTIAEIGAGLQCLAVSPDGDHVYAGRAIYSRDSGTGALTSLTGRTGVEGRGVTISADGNFVYATGTSLGAGAIEVFGRNAGTGALTSIQELRDGVGGVDGLAGADNAVISPDGKHVYVNGRNDQAIAVFTRNAGTGLLTFVEMKQEGVGAVFGLHDTTALSMSPDGLHLYASGWYEPSSVALFTRDPLTGKLKQTAVYRGSYSGCPRDIESGCKVPTLPGKAKLLVNDSAIDSKDAINWKWGSGEATDFSEWGDPLTDNYGEYYDYGVCMYDDTGLLAAAVAPAGATCRTKPCWKEVVNKLGDQLGYDYKDALRASSGLNKITVRNGDDGKARASAKLSGLNLTTPPPPYSGTVVFQIRHEEGCWEASYSSPTINQPGLYQANSD